MGSATAFLCLKMGRKWGILGAELHRTIWAIADELRVSVDRWDFKSYILGMLFYKYISENITAYINKGEWETGNKSFNYADLDDAIAEGARLKRSP